MGQLRTVGPGLSFGARPVVAGPGVRRLRSTCTAFLLVAAVAAIVWMARDGFSRHDSAVNLAAIGVWNEPADSVGPSAIAPAAWHGTGPLRVRMDRHGIGVGDTLKIKVCAPPPEGPVRIQVVVGSRPIAEVTADEEWRQFEMTSDSAGSFLELRRVDSTAAVHLARISVSNVAGFAGPPFETYVLHDTASAARQRPGKATLLLATLPLLLGMVGVLLSRGRGVRGMAALADGAVAAAAGSAWLVAAGMWDLWSGQRIILAPSTVVAVTMVGWLFSSAAIHRDVIAETARRSAFLAVRLASSAGRISASVGDRAAAWLGLREIGRHHAALLTGAAVTCVALFALGVVGDLEHPLVGDGDLNLWASQAEYVRQNTRLLPLPHLELHNDFQLYPYGGTNVFQPWVLELNASSAALVALFGPGPWEQLFYCASVAITLFGTYFLLAGAHGRRRAVFVAFAAAFANYYAIAKFPEHLNVALVHWTALGLFTDALILWRWSHGRAFSARLLALRVLLAVLALGQDLAYVTGVSLTSLIITGVWIVTAELLQARLRGRVLARRLAEVVHQARSSAREHPGQVVALAAATAVALLILMPTLITIHHEASAFDFSAVPSGTWWSSPLRLLMPVLPWLNPIEHQRLVRDSNEGWFGASPGLFFVGAAVLGLACGDRRARRAVAPAVLLLVLLVSFHPERFPLLQQLPWFQFARVTSRFTVAYPVLLLTVALALPPGWFRGWRRAVAAAGFALLLLEMSTAYRLVLLGDVRIDPPDRDFLALMDAVRSAPGEAVLDWPFCLAGGNGVATEELGAFYHLQNAVAVNQLFHGKKITAKYFGRLHPDQMAPYLAAGWQRMFVPDDLNPHQAKRQRRDMTETEWHFMRDFLVLNDFCGVILYRDLLPRETLDRFHAEVGPPIAVAHRRPFGTMEFIPKPRSWHGMASTEAGRRLVLADELHLWPRGQRIYWAEGASRDFRGQGWWRQQTRGREAEIRFALDPKDEPTFLAVRVQAMIEPQRLEGLLNGRTIGSVEVGLRPPQVVSVELPREALQRQNRLVLRLSNAVATPRSGSPGVVDLLGLEMEWMQLGGPEQFSLPLSERIEFGGDGAASLLREGWGGPRPEFRRSEAHRAVLEFVGEPGVPADLILQAGTFQRQRVGFQLNGFDLGQVTLEGTHDQRVRVPLPGHAVRSSNRLVLHLPDAHSPASVGVNQDTRLLGIAVRWMEMAPSTGVGTRMILVE